eukprot:gene10858-12013_t
MVATAILNSLFLGVLVAEIVSAQFCGKLGSYNALCVKNDAVFIVTASPCHTKRDSKQIALTIINTKGKFQEYDMGSSKDIKKPVSFGRKDVGVMLEMHRHVAGKLKGNIHVTVSLGNFSDNGVKSRKKFLEVNFYMEKEGVCPHSYSGASHYPSPSCRASRRTGNYSSYCISKDTTSFDKKSEGIFIVSMDPCTFPYTYWLVALFPTKNIEVVKRYTASKTDQFVAVESATCGMKAKVSSDHNLFPVVLLYGCNDATAVQLINDMYFPAHGELCPRAYCTSPSTLQRKCNVNMITGESTSASVSTNFKLSGCGKAMTANLSIAMQGQAKPLNLLLFPKRENEDYADFSFVGKQTKSEHRMPEITTGFLPSTGGHLSLIIESYDDDIEEHEHVHSSRKEPEFTYAVAERHYGEGNDTVHFVSTMFITKFDTSIIRPIPSLCLPKGKGVHLKSRARLSVAAKVLITLSVIVVIIALIALVYVRWRATRNRLDGLPHHIELNYDVDEDKDFSVESP